MNDRLMIAAMAMQGMLASPDCIGDAQAVSGDAIELADALLAAAGEKDITDKQMIGILDGQVRALKAEIEVHHPAVCAEYESKLAACERERDALKRRLEPLTLQEGGGVNNPIIYGSRPLAWDEITAIVADADRIRSRRQP